MKRFFIFLLIVTLFGITGCSKEMEWRHNSHSDYNRFNQDKSECELEALKFGQTSMFGGDWMSNAVFSSQRQNQIFQGCMRVKGYYLAPVSE